MGVTPKQPPPPNTPDPPSIKQVERKLDEIKTQAEQLDDDIREAEAKRPPPIDHADDGGVI